MNHQTSPSLPTINSPDRPRSQTTSQHREAATRRRTLRLRMLLAALAAALLAPLYFASPAHSQSESRKAVGVATGSKRVVTQTFSHPGSRNCPAIKAMVQVELTGVNTAGAKANRIRWYNTGDQSGSITFLEIANVGGRTGLPASRFAFSKWLNLPQFGNTQFGWNGGVGTQMVIQIVSGPPALCGKNFVLWPYLKPPAGINTVPNQVERLYRATFQRGSDNAGLNFWMGKRMIDKWSISRVANHFAVSREFQRKYGSLNNDQFVDRVYRNVLGRAADAGGKRYWVSRLNSGLSRGDLMLHFSDSDEFRRRTGIR